MTFYVADSGRRDTGDGLTYQEAVAEVNETCDWLEGDGWTVDRSWASSGNYFAARATRGERVRFIAVEAEDDDSGGQDERDLITDSDAMNAITAALSGQEWSPDHLDRIAEIVAMTGRTIANSDEYDDEITVEPAQGLSCPKCLTERVDFINNDELVCRDCGNRWTQHLG